MVKLEVTRKGETDQFLVTVDTGYDRDAHSDREKLRAALSKAKALARALDAAIKDGSSEAL
jgi:hypothetical protein